MIPFTNAPARRRAASAAPLLRTAAAIAVGALAALSARPAAAQNPAVTVTVDVGANRHPISPLVYGVGDGDPISVATLSDLNVPLTRLGGTPSTRYNWTLDADNRGNDYYFESIWHGGAAGAFDDNYIGGSQTAGALPVVTVPLIDWIAKVDGSKNTLGSFPQSLYPGQDAYDAPWGSGTTNGGSPIYGKDSGGSLILDFTKANNDPNLANTPNSTTVQANWLTHIIGKWGTAATTGVRYYAMDQESGIWHSSHHDVHPAGAAMDEMWGKFQSYGKMVKTADPAAKILAPDEWNYEGYLYSGKDEQFSSVHQDFNPADFPDRAAHGGMDYLPWLLGKYAAYDAANHQRLLDILSVHYYPQGNADGSITEYSTDVSTAAQQLRNQSTRSLWDPDYTDVSYVNDKIQLIPRLKGWVAQYYPGTQIALMEYNWGAEGHMNGATTQADISGILGREGLDMATRWLAPPTGSPTYKALQMYRNYDGSKGSFADTSVSAAVPNPDVLSAFAAQSSADGSVTIMVVSKSLSGTTPVTVNVANFGATATAKAYQLAATNPGDQTVAAITALADVPMTNGTISLSVPSPSVTLLRLPKAAVVGTGTGLRGTYYAGTAITGNPVAVRTDPQIAFNFGARGTPGVGGLGHSNFSVEWQGTVTAPVAGAYTFATVTATEVSLSVSGVPLITDTTDHAVKLDRATQTVLLTVGQSVPVDIRYTMKTGVGQAYLYWSYAGQPYQVVPQKYLTPAP